MGYISIEGTTYDSFRSMVCNAIESVLSIVSPARTSSTSMSCALAPRLVAASSTAKSVDLIYFTVLFIFLALLATILELCNGRLIVIEFAWSEETVNLYKSILYRIGRMDNILLATH